MMWGSTRVISPPGNLEESAEANVHFLDLLGILLEVIFGYAACVKLTEWSFRNRPRTDFS